MKKRLSFYPERFIALVIPLLVLSSCNNDKNSDTTSPPKITVVEVIQRDVPIYNDFVGQIYGQEDVAINARVEGFLTGIHFTEGTQVNKGELLVKINNAELLALLKKNVIEEDLAKDKEFRAKQLLEKNLSSQQEYDVF